MSKKPHFVKCGPCIEPRDWRRLPVKDLTRAERNMKFCESYLKIPEGKDAGKPLYFIESLERFFYDVFDNPAGTRKAILSMARKNAKALCLKTEIPTPDGFRTVEQLKPGDFVFSPDGNPVKINLESEIFYDKECYKIIFSDGSEVIASEDHLWETYSKWKPWDRKTFSNGRLRGKTGQNGRITKSIVTTKQIFETVNITRADGQNERNHKIMVNSSVQFEKNNLTVDPYLLGYWLGDGNSAGNRISCGEQDIDSLKMNFSKRGIKFRIRKEKTVFTVVIDSEFHTSTKRKKVFTTFLTESNLINNKHIPEIYLTSSESDRLELLRGLLDSDGTVNMCGGKTTPRVSFCSTNERLAKNVWCLTRSLGFKSSITTSRAKIYGKDCGISYKVEFAATSEKTIFSLDRKQKKLPKTLGKRSGSIQIVDCKPVGKIPCKCFTIDSDDGLFLVGRGCVTTHNSTAIACILVCFLVGPEAKMNTQIISGAMSRDQAALIYKLASKMIRMSKKLSPIVKEIPSKKMLIGLPLNTEFQALAADGATAQGLSVYLGLIDEAGQVRGPTSDFISAIETSQGAHESPLMIYLSTQAPTDADFLSILIDDAINSQDPHTVCHLYAAPDNCDLNDEEAWKMANPGLGLFRSLKDLQEQIKEALRLPSKESSTRNLLLNQRISVESPFVSKSVWQDNGVMPQPLTGKKVYAGLDLSAVSDLTGLVMVSEEGDVECRAWLPKEGLVEKARDDRVPYDVWAKQGFLQTTPGRSIEYEWVAQELRRVFSEYDVQQLNFDRYNMKFLRPWLERAGFTKAELEKFKEMGQGFVSMGPALRSLETALLQKQLKHGNHPILTMCAANAVVEMDAAGNRKFTKKKATGRIDLLVCLAMAEDARSAQKKPESKEWSFHIV